ncbi:flagellin modification protein FlmH [Enhygromyxa salina]|uniref:Flagellin modification protein FlmH n=1 Tax=Enhygromyxa salina TaxID=215803 RepID=A0A0C2CTQ3_9BACT|nr:GNAT family protein [Enhygromyxa salina]KIG13000.1 flagellin modification protein FlmH [Enhygromyxa salina]
MTTDKSDLEQVERRQQEQMLKLVTKGFFNELVNYGVPKGDIVTIATHLLGHVSKQESQPSTQDHFYSRIFDVNHISDRWADEQMLQVDRSVVLRPLDDALLDQVSEWLAEPGVRSSFVTPYPATTSGTAQLAAHFASAACRYFCIEYEGEPVGIIGAENLDEHARRLEMRKLVGHRELQGMGIGKRATFAFLYYAFKILAYEKVYIYSTDVNVRNLNLNSQFGFALEGVFLQELQGAEERLDILRMGLMRSRWVEIFESG